MENNEFVSPVGIVVIVALLVLAGWLILRPRADFQGINQSSNQNINSMNNMNDQKPDFPPPIETASLFPEGNQSGYIVAPMGRTWVKINDDWSLRLDSVLGDGRCPKGVDCVTAGFATVKVQFQQPNVDEYKAYFEEMKVQGLNRFPPTNELKSDLFEPIKISGSNQEGEDIGFTVALVDLIPYPVYQEDQTQQKNYVGLFKIIEN